MVVRVGPSRRGTMSERALLLVVAKAATLTFGTLLTYFSYRAYRRTNSGALRALTVGIGLVTTGAILGGGLHQLAGFPLRTSVTVQSVFTAAGFAFLTYSLYTEPSPERSPEPVGRSGGHENG
jgi:threonine/homoserine/homoserine lactone efflux protein